MYPVTVFIERFRAAVSVHIGPCCPALIVFVQMCILLYYWANKMMMMIDWLWLSAHFRSLCTPADIAGGSGSVTGSSAVGFWEAGILENLSSSFALSALFARSESALGRVFRTKELCSKVLIERKWRKDVVRLLIARILVGFTPEDKQLWVPAKLSS